MEQIPSCEASSRSISQNPPPLMKPEGSLLCSQEPATGPYFNPDDSSPRLPNLFL